METYFTFDDVLIVPQFSDIQSRKDVDLSVYTSPKLFRWFGSSSLPVISANMDTITDARMARSMLKYGAQACLHRFCTIEENVKMFSESEVSVEDDEDCRHSPMVSIGLGKEELDRAYALYGNCATRFVIDVAHGAQQAVVDQAKKLREIIKDNGAIMVGNFASGSSVEDFIEKCGPNVVDAAKVGVGPGSACTTRIKTGVGFPQLSAIEEIARVARHFGFGVIADGGMKTPGDIAKALGAGAHMVMLGGMLAGTDETPGEIFYPEGPGPQCPVKSYRGSASQESYEAQGKKGTHRTSEGESFMVPYKGSVVDVLQDIEGGLRSSFTYVGARNIGEFHEKVEFVRITNATSKENGAHGK